MNGKQSSQPGFSPKPITQSKLLVVEGNDEEVFLQALTRKMEPAPTLEIRVAGGISKLPNYLRTLPTISGFAKVRSLGVIRDAEQDARAAFQSVRDALRRANLPTPVSCDQPITTDGLRVGVFILPDCASNGMLETLCLVALTQDPVIECVDKFMSCVTDKRGASVRNPDKARFHAFLASCAEPGLLLGQAAFRDYVPLGHPAFDRLKTFLRTL